jgi:hypothetical protein
MKKIFCWVVLITSSHTTVTLGETKTFTGNIAENFLGETYPLSFCNGEIAVCGQKAADIFCREKKFAFAVAFAKSSQILRAGSGPWGSFAEVCTSDGCRKFASITCSNDQVAIAKPVVSRQRKGGKKTKTLY